MNDISILEPIVGITFKNTVFIKQAFVHRSALNESKQYTVSNERLEFLGDSVLSFLVSGYLYQNFPKITEGELTNLRSSLVNTNKLAEISRTLNLGQFLMLSKGEEESGGRDNTSILADTFEAFLGAIYLDQGIDAARTVLEKMLFPLLAKILSDKAYKDGKSMFQELVQNKTKVSPVYKVLKEIGPDHAKKFTVGVYVNNTLYGEGHGKSKQEAEMHSAEAALEKWKEKI